VRSFHPLDADERTPREDLRETRGGLSFRTMDGAWRGLSRAEIAAAIAIPALVLLGVAVGESGTSFPVGAAAFVILIGALAALAISGRHHGA